MEEVVDTVVWTLYRPWVIYEQTIICVSMFLHVRTLSWDTMVNVVL